MKVMLIKKVELKNCDILYLDYGNFIKVEIIF